MYSPTLRSRTGGLRDVSTAQLPNARADVLPRRFVQQWGATEGLALTMAKLVASRRRDIAVGLHAWQVLPSGTPGYNKAEVTPGGVDTRGLSSKTMGALGVPGSSSSAK